MRIVCVLYAYCMHTLFCNNLCFSRFLKALPPKMPSGFLSGLNSGLKLADCSSFSRFLHTPGEKDGWFFAAASSDSLCMLRIVLVGQLFPCQRVAIATNNAEQAKIQQWLQTGHAPAMAVCTVPAESLCCQPC